LSASVSTYTFIVLLEGGKKLLDDPEWRLRLILAELVQENVNGFGKTTTATIVILHGWAMRCTQLMSKSIPHQYQEGSNGDDFVLLNADNT